MKTEFLKELGLSQEVIDKIMAENGKDIAAEQTKATAKDTELATANQTIRGLQDTVKKFDGVDVDKLKDDLQALQTKYDADTTTLRMDAALDVAVVASKAKNPKLVKAAINREKLKLDGDKLLGLDDQLEALRKSDTYLFDDAAPPPAKSPVTVSSGGSHQTPPPAKEAPATLLGALQGKFNNEGE